MLSTNQSQAPIPVWGGRLMQVRSNLKFSRTPVTTKEAQGATEEHSERVAPGQLCFGLEFGLLGALLMPKCEMTVPFGQNQVLRWGELK